MFIVALRNIIGYAVQILPCAVLCLAPFAGKLHQRERSIIQAVGIFAIGLIPFLLAGCDVLPPALSSLRLLLQNVIFLAVVGCLLALFARRVSAPLEHKVFVFLLVMCYGAIVTQTNDALITLLHLEAESDGYMYPPVKLISLCAVNTALIIPAANAMRRVGEALVGLGCGPLVRRLSIIPAGLIIVLVAVGWLPTAWFSDEQVYWLTLLALFVFAGILLTFMMRTMHDITRDRTDLLQLEEALRRSEDQREELSSKLHARETDRGEKHRGGGITVSTGSGSMSLATDEILYVESVNRSRVIFLADGSSVSLSAPLAKLAESLPTGQFIYCHRSYVVNLKHVRSVSRGGLTLDSGQKLPIGRSHYDEVRSAFLSR